MNDFPNRLLLALALCVAACFLLAPEKASAQSGISCWITTTPNINFGNVGPGGTTTTTTLGFTCSQPNNNYNYRLCLYMNPNYPTGIDPRQMVYNGSTYMNYNLYADSAHTQLIGSETSGAPVYSTTLGIQGNKQGSGSMPIYGAVVPGQTLTAATYTGNTDVRLHYAYSSSGTPTDAQCQSSPLVASQSMLATAIYTNGCYISTATDMQFGNAPSLATAVDSTSSISFQCPTGTQWKVGLDNGQNASGTTRRMIGPGGVYLSYELYQNTARSVRWGNTPGTDTVNGTISGTAAQILTVYGRVPAQTVGASGAYSDTVTVTLTY